MGQPNTCTIIKNLPNGFSLISVHIHPYETKSTLTAYQYLHCPEKHLESDGKTLMISPKLLMPQIGIMVIAETIRATSKRDPEAPRESSIDFTFQGRRL